VKYAPPNKAVTSAFAYSPTMPACDTECGAGGAFKYEVTSPTEQPDLLGCTEELDGAGNRTQRFCCPTNECTRLPAIDAQCAQYHPGYPKGFYCDGPSGNLPKRNGCLSYNGSANDAGFMYLQWCCPA
jgi:hypothetical protein